MRGLVGIVLLVPSFAPLLVPTAIALAGAPDWRAEDAPGDALFEVGVNGVPVGVPAPGADERANNADILRLRIVNETGLYVGFEVTMSSWTQPTLGVRLITVAVCFQIHDTPIRLFAAVNPALPTPHAVGMAAEDCSARWLSGGARGYADARAATVGFVVAKKDLDHLTGNKAVRDGDKVDSIRVDVVASLYNFGLLATRVHDFLDVPADKPYVMLEGARGGAISILARPEGKSLPSCLRRAEPVYLVEAGEYVRIPLAVASHLPNPSHVMLQVIPPDSTWTATVTPGVHLEAGFPKQPALLNVTITVKAPVAGTKQCSIIRVLADIPGTAESAELDLEVISTQGLTPVTKDLHFHLLRAGGTPDNALYLNSLAADPAALDDVWFPFYRTICSFQNGGGCVEPTAMNKKEHTFRAETSYPYQILVPSDKPIAVDLWLRSGLVATHARLRAGFGSGSELFATGSAEVDIPAGDGTDGGEGHNFPLTLQIIPDAWKSAVRSLPANQRLYFTIKYEPLSVKDGVPTPPGYGSGRVEWRLDRSKITVDVQEIVRTNLLGIGSNGGFVTLSSDGVNERRLVNPGRTLRFAFNATNEGVDPDTFAVRWNVTAEPKGAWKVAIVGGSTSVGPLAPGQAGSFELAIQAPVAVPEGAEARIYVSVEGLQFKARASAPVTARVALDQEHGGTEAIGGDGPLARKTPSPPTSLALVAFIVLAVALRRRR